MSSLLVGMRGIFQDGCRFENFQMLISLLSYFIRLYNWLSWLLLHWEMLLVPSEISKPLPVSCSIIGLKARFPGYSSFSFFLSFSLSTSLRWAIPVLPGPLELVSSQFFSAWVKDVQRQGQKKKQNIFWLWISWLWQPWLCGLMPFKLLLTWYAWIQLSMVAMLCKLMLQIDSLHKKGAHNQCNSTANYSAI